MRTGSLSLALLVIWCALTPAQDPFNEAYRAPNRVVQVNKTPIDDRIDFDITLEPRQARRGQTVRLTIHVTPQPGYYTYPMTQKSADEAQPEAQLSRLKYKETKGLQPLPPITETEPVFVKIEGLGVFLEHKKPFTWTQDLLVLPDATPGPVSLAFSLNLQVCKESCVIGEPQFEGQILISDEPAVPLTAELQERVKQKAEIKIIPVPKDLLAAEPRSTPVPNATSQPRANTSAAGPQSEPLGFWGFLAQGLLFGILSVGTPCVFPMIPITVSFFIKQSEKQGHKAISLAIVYSLTIITVLSLAGLLLIKVLQPLSMHWSTNLFLGGLFIFFALSLFGMYEIQLPSSLARFTSAQEGRGGFMGVFFMALTFTIISFTCVAPFYGSFVAMAAASTTVTDWVKLALGAVTYSTAFASPFFLLALFPTALRKLPKSGSWMNTIKVVMAFLELAAAVKLLRQAELAWWGTASASFLTYDLAIGMYVAILMACGLYLLNVYRLPHDDPIEHLGVPRLMFSLLFLSLGLYLMPALFKSGDGEPQRPRGHVFAWLDAFLLRDVPEGEGPNPAQTDKTVSVSRLSWVGNLADGLKKAEEQKTLVFIDFTGVL